jgi:hypothetical protein
MNWLLSVAHCKKRVFCHVTLVSFDVRWRFFSFIFFGAFTIFSLSKREREMIIQKTRVISAVICNFIRKLFVYFISK